MTTPQTQTPRHALISGASIAGPALAYWLGRYGWQTTIVERAPELRLGGQNVDVRGAGREVLRRMRLEDAVRAHGTGEDGTSFIGLDGESKADFPAGKSDTDGATAELEILRGDMAKLLYDATKDETEYLFGDTIRALHYGERVRVTFESGTERDFDLVVAADGVRSSTRDLILGGAATEKVIGEDMAYFTIPRLPSDVDWWRWYHAPGRRSVSLRPDNKGTIRANLAFVTDERGNARKSTEEQKALLRRVFADAGWETERILDGMDKADDFYYDALTQIKASRWSSGGRAVVVGDAAYCPTPMTGMGTSLALVGAYVLAGEIAAHVDLRDAFRGYERILRPYVKQAQQLPPGTPNLAHPQTKLGIGIGHALLGLAASKPLRAIGGKLFSPPADKIELPEYRHLEGRA